MKFRILDLDNCISDDEWRIPFINWSEKNPTERYKAYHSGCGLDEFKNQHLVNEREDGDLILIFTARPESVLKQTMEWLKRNVPATFMLCMRNDNDNSSSVEVKRKFLLEFKEFAPTIFENIKVAYDDKEDVVQMYRSFGIEAHVVSIHNTSAYQKAN